MQPLYEHMGELRFQPTNLTRGPWSANAQHGGPPSALLAHLLCAHSDEPTTPGPPLLLARTTVELLRPVPIAPLCARVRTLRPGRKVQLLEASLWTGDEAGSGTEVVRAVGLCLRRGRVHYPELTNHANDAIDAITQQHRPVGTPDAGKRWRAGDREGFTAVGYHAEAVELRLIDGALDLIGPGIVWGRLLCPLVDDLAATGVPLALAISDFGNAVSSIVPAEVISFINADLTVSLHREPVGEWICLDAVSRVSPIGVGLASASLHDLDGPIGRSAASLLIEQR